ncbi:MAG: hypothetical protein FJY29_13140 [Betaproteobacteria bacterium]|nr:hypothetical protein [Betaproteobacteria bacterium]
MRRSLTTAALAAVCLSSASTSLLAHSTESTPELGVVLLGDQGKGNAGQLQVAEALSAFCKRERCDFGILLGDNFYNSGVKNIDDSKFKTHFEQPYGQLGIEFWAVLGNHDYGFGFARGNIQAQIDYTQKSKFWRMPTRYYSFHKNDIEFVALDTVALPRDRDQQSWLDRTLDKPKPGFRVVLGHYPIHSGGQHGDTRFMRDNVSQKLCGKADIYASGHDHHLEHLKTDCGVELLLSGAAAETRSVNATPRTLFAASTLGFAYLKKTSESELKIQYIDSALNVLAEFAVEKAKERTVD